MTKYYQKIFTVTTMAILAAFYSEAALPSKNTVFSLEVRPEFPKAGEEFVVRARPFIFDILSSDVQWSLNGKVIAQGKGTTEQTLKAGRLGSSMVVEVIALSVDNIKYTAETEVFINDIDLIVRPLTYTPSYYRGAAMATPASTVEIFAIPHLFQNSLKVGAQKFVYTWFISSKKLLAQSGGGKNKLTLQLADVGSSEYEVDVMVLLPGTNISAKKSVKINTRKPEILFYATSQLTGRKPNYSTSFNAKAGEIFSVIAEPYFMAIESLERANFKWIANGQVFSENPDNQRLLEINAPSGVESRSDFAFSIEDTKTIFQRVIGSLSVTARP